jgi:hypothetical protein
VFFFNNFVPVDQIHPIQANKRTIYSRYNFDGPCAYRRIVGLLFVDWVIVRETSGAFGDESLVNVLMFLLVGTMISKQALSDKEILFKYALSFGQRF